MSNWKMMINALQIWHFSTYLLKHAHLITITMSHSFLSYVFSCCWCCLCECINYTSLYCTQRSTRTQTSIPFCPTSSCTPWPTGSHVTWMHQIENVLLTFFQASYRPHSSPTVSHNKQLRRTRETGRDGLSYSQRQQWIPYSLYRDVHPHRIP